MARIRPAKKLLHSYTIHGTSSVVRAGDCVLMRAYEARSPPYVAKVERIEAEDQSDIVKVHVRWYYRPEEILGGRRAFHGAKEVFSSDHFDIQNVDTIEGKCKVHAFTEYMKLPSVGADDYFYRFQYNPADGSFTPDRVAVYCICEMPYNPDDLMVECDGCKDWFHPSCLNVTPEEAKKTEPFLCLACSSEAGDKLPRNSPLVSPPSTPMPQLKRRKK